MTLRDDCKRLLELAERATPGPYKFEPRQDSLPPMIVQDQEAGAPAGWCIAALMMDDDFDESLKEQASKNGPFFVAAANTAPELAKAMVRIEEFRDELKKQVADCYVRAARSTCHEVTVGENAAGRAIDAVADALQKLVS